MTPCLSHAYLPDLLGTVFADVVAGTAAGGPVDGFAVGVPLTFEHSVERFAFERSIESWRSFVGGVVLVLVFRVVVGQHAVQVVQHGRSIGDARGTVAKRCLGIGDVVPRLTAQLVLMVTDPARRTSRPPRAHRRTSA